MPAFADIFGAAASCPQASGGSASARSSAAHQNLLGPFQPGATRHRGGCRRSACDSRDLGGVLAGGGLRPRGSRRDFGSFLDPHSAVALQASVPRRSAAANSDFLFGRDGATSGGGGGHGKGHRAEPTSAAAGRSLDLTPRLAMVAGAGSVASATRKAWQMLDPFGKDDDEDQGGGVQKVLLPTLRASLAFDVFSLAALLGSIHQPCDVPLKLWLLGGMALGFPVDHFVRSVADGKPAFEWYRLKVTSTRGNRDASHMAIGSIVLYDQLKQPIDPGFVDQHKDGEYWRMHLVRCGKELITAYQPVTHRDASPDLDPSTWIFEGSVDGVTWQVLDEVSEAEALPYARDASHLIFDELFHLGKASAAFRTAFLVEALATGASLSWLLAGSVWVSAGTETCVDTAPMLWYPCYFAVVVMWSLVFSGFVMVIISGVMSVVRRRQP